jgi:hypothetical protein
VSHRLGYCTAQCFPVLRNADLGIGEVERAQVTKRPRRGIVCG